MSNAIVIGIRTKCYEQLNALNPEKSRYFKELEARIFNISGQPANFQQMITAYYRKYTQLYFNLKLFCDELTNRYKPSELVFLSEVDLNKNVKAEREHNIEQNRLYKKILAQGIDLEEGEEGEEGEQDDAEDGAGGAENKCRNPECKNTKKFIIIPRQLRSGDEPMSLFFTCSKCAFQWRVG
jgi:DNA-directed RNA polymerase subunit M/transcription elongation factor TFIIS